jgi:cytochrome P450
MTCIGHDTTAHTMSFLIHTLLKNPDKYEVLMNEIDGIFTVFCVNLMWHLFII